MDFLEWHFRREIFGKNLNSGRTRERVTRRSLGRMPMEPWEGQGCERCGSREIAEIIYGLVTPDVEAEYPDRRIILGGCVIEATSPRWQCLNCGHPWGRAFLDANSGE